MTAQTDTANERTQPLESPSRSKDLPHLGQGMRHISGPRYDAEMRRLVLFFDGTWNTPKSTTNVTRLRDSLSRRSADGRQQLGEYVVGIGTRWNRRIRGAFGKEVNDRVRKGYRFLVNAYRPGDEIFILGFSRGAFAARSLAGFLDRCGLLRDESVLSVEEVFERYRLARLVAGRAELAGVLEHGGADLLSEADRRLVGNSDLVPIQFVGVWDTVRYYDLPFGNIRGLSRSQNLFHEIQPTASNHNLYQALAIDEHRRPYRHEAFNATDLPAGVKLEQRWFAGAHSNVGGGYRNNRLADVPLAWIQSRAIECGLSFDTVVQLRGDEHLEAVIDSYARFLLGTYRFIHRRYTRQIRPNNTRRSAQAAAVETIDGTVFDRCRRLGYEPTNLAQWADRSGQELNTFSGVTEV